MRDIAGLGAIAETFDAIVFDQWGVLHNGTLAYPGALEAVRSARRETSRLAVLSNSGKRSEPNRARIAAMGFDLADFALVMTSGEALWQDCHAGRLSVTRRLFPICAKESDAILWAEGLSAVELVATLEAADGVLLMGLADEADAGAAVQSSLDQALSRGLPLYCSNPDKASPRANGIVVQSPGALAEAYRAASGIVHFYGKPHPAVFEALQRELGVADPSRILMIGDSFEHDIAGAKAMGWASLFIRGGLHAAAFTPGEDCSSRMEHLCEEAGCALPDYTMELLYP
jgi:HAD superfamily hydrolase (TIGR01459 family)